MATDGYYRAIAAAEAEHRPLFEEVERLTGLKPVIWQSGGMTMTVVIPLTAADQDTDTEWPPIPCYMGLQEGEDEDGRWFGSVGFIATRQDREEGTEVEVVRAWEDPLTPVQWAAQIAAHYREVAKGDSR